MNRLVFFALLGLLSNSLFASTVIEKDYSNYFGKFQGTMVVYDQENDRYTVHNRKRSLTPYTPFSTFKIPNSVIALETGVIGHVDSIYQWDTARYPVQNWWPATWNGKHTMRSAIKNSVVPFYRDIASHVGPRSMGAFVTRFKYGNMDISSGVDEFWLNGSMKITAMGQIDFLVKFYNNRLGVSEKTTSAVKSILLQEKTPGYMLSAKTGGGTLDTAATKELGWYVGYVEKQSTVYFFSLNIDAASTAEIIATRIDIARAVLKDIGAIE